MMKILVNWDYERKDLMHPFALLQEEIEWVFIYKGSAPGTGREKLFGTDVLYWNDYSSPYDLLQQVKPGKVLFHDIESFPQVALNIAAKNTGIETLVLEHGLRAAYEIDIAYENARSPRPATAGNAVPAASKGKSSLLFYLRAFRLKNIASLLHFLRFPFTRKKYGLTIGLHRSPFSLREADRYINFTMHNASYILKRDHIAEEKVIAIGNPNFDAQYEAFEKYADAPKENYYLLIDAPYCEQAIFGMPQQQKIAFYRKLNEFCLLKGARLKIKLHPQSYTADYLPAHANIDYIREALVSEYIMKAQGCILVNLSTLSPLAMYYSRCIYMNSGLNPYDRELIGNQYVPEYDFNRFDPAALDFKEITPALKAGIKNAYLYATDGKATQRLKQILLR